MGNPKVRVYVRAKLPNGSRPFLDPVYAGNQKLKPGWAVLRGQPQYFEEAVYYLRYLKNGKRVYEPIGDDAQEALHEQDKRQKLLGAIACGVIALEARPLRDHR